jgi:hypothetical protein
VLLLDAFLTGSRADVAVAGARRRPFNDYFCTYNRTNLQERVQDLVTATAFLRSHSGVRSVVLAGCGRAGLWALLGAPAADAVAADCDRFDLTTDDELLDDDMFVPGLRRWGGFRTSAALAAPHPLLLHNIGSRFDAAPWIAAVYQAVAAQHSLSVDPDRRGDDALAAWLISYTGSRPGSSKGTT